MHVCRLLLCKLINQLPACLHVGCLKANERPTNGTYAQLLGGPECCMTRLLALHVELGRGGARDWGFTMVAESDTVHSSASFTCHSHRACVAFSTCC